MTTSRVSKEMMRRSGTVAINARTMRDASGNATLGEALEAKPSALPPEVPGVYKVPASVALVMSSGRHELMSVALREVLEGHVEPTKALTYELLRLVRDLLKDQNAAMREGNDLRERLERYRETAATIRTALAELDNSDDDDDDA